MANEELHRQQPGEPLFEATAPAGQKAQAEKETPLTPAQQKLRALEARLPGGMAARVLAVAMALVAVLGFGGLKLRGYYDATAQSFTVGSTTNDAQGDSVMDELNAIVNDGATVLRAAGQYEQPAVQQAVQTAQAAQQALVNAMESGDVGAMYAANRQFYSAVDAVRSAVQAVDSSANLSGATSFFSHQAIVSHLEYNDEAAEYNRTAGGFPANIIGSLWGCKEVDLFA